MRRQEAIRKLNAIRDLSRCDPEVAHVDADKILLELIDEPEVTEAFESINRWYA